MSLFLLNLSKRYADTIRCFYKTITHDEIVLLDNKEMFIYLFIVLSFFFLNLKLSEQL